MRKRIRQYLPLLGMILAILPFAAPSAQASVSAAATTSAVIAANNINHAAQQSSKPVFSPTETDGVYAHAATNSHQDHQGACARSTTTVSKGVGDLAYNGVLGKFAGKFGIKPINGSLKKQMENRLGVGKVASVTTTNNSGCTGSGGTFPAGKRTLYKGESVIFKVPAKYGKDVCNHSHKGCKAITLTFHFVLPGSCWNGNSGTIRVTFWVKKGKSPSKPKKKAKKPAAKPTPQNQQQAQKCTIPGNPVDGSGNCVQQQNQQQVQGAGNCNSTNSGNLSGTGDVQGSCNQVNVVCNGMGSCSPSTTNTCTANTSGGTASNGSTGGDATSNVCNTNTCSPSTDSCNTTTPPCTTGCTPPPCEHDCTPPPPPTPPSCDDLVITHTSAKTGLYGTGLGIAGKVLSTDNDDTFVSQKIDWGDGASSTTTTKGATLNHTYSQKGTYNLVGSATYKTNGVTTSLKCKETVTVTLSCPSGSTPNQNGSDCVKDGNTTPPPPDPAPGPNPDPSPDDPAPGGHACYDKNTGAPVEPVIVNGVALCPSGSYGNP